MKTTIEKTFQVQESKAKTWEYLSHPAKIVTCVPGASLTEKLDERNYKGEVIAKFGPVKAKYNGQITIEELDNANYKMVLKGKGLDSKGKGSAEMTMHGKLIESGDGTEVNFEMELAITGMLAQFGARLIKDVSNQLLNQFVDNFKDLLAGKEVDNAMNAGKVMGSVVKSKLGGILGEDKKTAK
ncbi:MAG: SRPBCC family protein [Leptolyngbya sp. SIO1D8]|nr:SRPBCC family protein [Leptolyngbya sp. SIO1D8]